MEMDRKELNGNTQSEYILVKNRIVYFQAHFTALYFTNIHPIHINRPLHECLDSNPLRPRLLNRQESITLNLHIPQPRLIQLKNPNIILPPTLPTPPHPPDRRQPQIHLRMRQIDTQALSTPAGKTHHIPIQQSILPIQPALRRELLRIRKDVLVMVDLYARKPNGRSRWDRPCFACGGVGEEHSVIGIYTCEATADAVGEAKTFFDDCCEVGELFEDWEGEGAYHVEVWNCGC